MQHTYRPYGHTLLVVLSLGALSLLWRRRSAGTALLAAAVGVTLHLVRDVATGGAALLWPITSATITYPHWLYLAGLVTAAAIAAAARRRKARGGAGAPGPSR